MNSGTKTAKHIWQCMTAVKVGKEYCEERRLIREEVVGENF